MNTRVLSKQEETTDWSTILEVVREGGDTVIEAGGRPVAVLMSYEDYLAIEEALEDMRDIRDAEAIAARIAAGEEDVVPWEVVKANLFPEGLPDD